MTQLKSLFLFFSLVFSILVTAQKKPLNFLLGQLPASTSPMSYSIAGYGNNFTGLNYNLRFSASGDGTPGFNTVIKLFEVDGETFSVTKAVPGAKPFSSVIIHRNSAMVKTTALFETAAMPPTANNSTIYLRPDYVANMEDLINSYIINRGTDNVFINGSSSTTNNIERFDMIMDEPINTAGVNLNQSGFLLMERGGNDAFKVSAITGLSGTTVTSLTASRSIASNIWGATGNSIVSVVFQRVVGTDADLKPSQNLASQAVSGVFVPLSALNLPGNATIYGISIYANDVVLSAANLLNLNLYPNNTPDNSGGVSNGLDFMAGGGFFTKAILINGSVWNDIDADAVIGGTEAGIANGLWANLVDPDGNLISSVAVSSTGTFKLFVADNNISTGNYRVILTNEEKYEGDILTAADAPLNDYGYTGTNFNGTASPTNRSGIIDIGPISGADINGVDFGINATVLPVTFSGLYAGLSDNGLLVKWTTLSETGNDYFDIELSENAVDFTKIGSVKSSATAGNSDIPINYEFKIAAGGMAALGSGLLLLLATGFVKRGRKLTLALLMVAGLSAVVISCVKEDGQSISIGKDHFVRIKQVDKDGNFRYSKAIKVIKP